MGKTTREKAPRNEPNLTQRPFNEGTIPVRAGPECLKCGDNIDTRLGRVPGDSRGALRPARQGWLCSKCAEPEEQKFYREVWHDLYQEPNDESLKARWKEFVAPLRIGGDAVTKGKRYFRDVVTSLTLEVPEHTHAELLQMLGGERA